MRGLSIFLLLVGITWALGIVLTYLTLSGLAVPVSVTRVLLYYGLLLTGPLMLIAGPILVMNSTHTKLGAVLAALGCSMLTVLVAYEIVKAMQVGALQVRPPVAVYGIMIMLVLLADIGAIRLYRIAAH